MANLIFPKGIRSYSYGRYFTSICVGFQFHDYNDRVTIKPINSRGTAYSCDIEIPKTELLNFIRELEKHL